MGQGEGESKGHESGRRIVADYNDDIEHMNKVTSYVHRHLGQGPKKQNVEDSKRRRSLMNLGHDPLK